MNRIVIVLGLLVISIFTSAQNSSPGVASIGAEIISAVGFSSEGNIIEGRLVKPFALRSLSSNKVLLLDESSPAFFIPGKELVYAITVVYEPHLSLKNKSSLKIASLDLVKETENETGSSYKIKPIMVADTNTRPGNYIDPGICRVIINFN